MGWWFFFLIIVLVVSFLVCFIFFKFIGFNLILLLGKEYLLGNVGLCVFWEINEVS